MTGDPLLAINPKIVNLELYKDKKNSKINRDSMATWESGVFEVTEVNGEGFIEVKKQKGQKFFKVLMSPIHLSKIKKGDILEIVIKKKIFFVYWEFEDMKNYYTSLATPYM